MLMFSAGMTVDFCRERSDQLAMRRVEIAVLMGRRRRLRASGGMASDATLGKAPGAFCVTG